MVINRIGVLSAARITAAIAAAFGLLAGILIFLASLATGSANAVSTAGTNDAGIAWLGGLGALAIVVLPIVYGILGFIGGAIQAFVYNIAAKYVGGVRLETS